MDSVLAWLQQKDAWYLKADAPRGASVWRFKQEQASRQHQAVESLLEQARPQDTNSFSFNRCRRLPEARDYKAVFDQSDFRASHKNALILARLNQSQYARLGLVISKKNVRRAVDRNKIKRLLREYFRLNQKMLSGLDMVFMARSGLANIGLSDARKISVTLFNQIKKQKS